MYEHYVIKNIYMWLGVGEYQWILMVYCSYVGKRLVNLGDGPPFRGVNF